MTTPRPDPDGERRRLFRRMEVVFVWAPPLLALAFGLLAGAVVAWILPLGGSTFAIRWLIASALLLGGTALVYGVVQWWGGRNR